LQPQLEHFRRAHRVIAFDLRGHGHSDRLAQPYTPATFADDITWLIYQLGVYRPVAIGRGVGGLIALALGAEHPELLAGLAMLDARFGASGRAGASDGAAMATVPHLAATWRIAADWDETAALARCALPVLRLAVHTTTCLNAAIEDFLAARLS
jgi:pimeloyl-ACP methyl ester carboxylesterase